MQPHHIPGHLAIIRRLHPGIQRPLPHRRIRHKKPTLPLRIGLIHITPLRRIRMVPFQRLPANPRLLLLLNRHPIPPIHPILSHPPDLQPLRIRPRLQRIPPRPRLHRIPPTPGIILHRRRGRAISHRPHRRLGRRRRRDLIRRNKPIRPARLGRLITSPHRINRPIIGKRRLPTHQITD